MVRAPQQRKGRIVDSEPRRVHKKTWKLSEEGEQMMGGMGTDAAFRVANSIGALPSTSQLRNWVNAGTLAGAGGIVGVMAGEAAGRNRPDDATMYLLNWKMWIGFAACLGTWYLTKRS